MTSVLISGAGIAGPTLAYWLARNGIRATVVERSAGLRSSGNPVDVRGTAMPVVEAMGLVPALRAAATRATAMCAVDTDGRQVARMPTPAGRGDTSEVEIPRADLAAILYRAAKDDVEFLFDDTIVEMHQDGDGVDVTFDRAAPRRFDLVVGADGLHSTVRRLAFGPESAYVRHMGVFVGTVPLGEPADDPHDMLMYNEPGRLVAVHPSRGEALVAFIFRGPTRNGPLDDGRRIVADAYAGAGWRVPALVERFVTADDVYFDSVSRVRLPSWSRGRVALVGDAASCVSLFGDGSSLAITGAATLAAALAAEPDHARALRRFEAEHRKLVAAKLRYSRFAATVLVPRSSIGIATRNAVARVIGRTMERDGTPQRRVPAAKTDGSARP